MSSAVPASLDRAPTLFDRYDFILAALAVVGCGIAAVAFGQSIGWDLRNYHLYAPWAWWSGRETLDFVPAQLQSFYNPTLHVPIAWLALHAPPMLTTFAIGAVEGLNIVLLACLTRALVRSLANTDLSLPSRVGRDATAHVGATDASSASRLPRWLVWSIAAVGGLGATSIGELGATQGDTLVTLPLLAGLVLLLHAPTPNRLVCAWLVMGAAVALKLTLAPLVLGFGLALPLLRMPVARIAVFAAAGTLGFALAAAPWMLTLWARYGNPLFPYLASAWPSPYDIGISGADMRFRPDGLVDALLYPVRWVFDWRQTSDVKFRDLRITTLAILLPWLAWRTRFLPALRWLFAAFAIGYATWAILFGYYRYLAVWEMLAVPLVGVALWHVTHAKRTAAIAIVRPRDARALVALLAVLLVTTNPPNWGNAAHGERFVDVDLTTHLPPASARPMVLLAGDAPLAYLALAAPPRTPFVRVSSNFFGPPHEPGTWDALAAERIARHDGALLLIHQSADPATLDATLAPLRLDPLSRCSELVEAWRIHGEPRLMICRIERR